MNYDWNDLRAFLAVARGGSAMAASKALGVNQTTVVRRLEALEHALGLKLVDRDQGGSRVTEAGQAILADAEQVEAAAGKLSRTAALYNRGIAGTVRVTCSELIANLIVVPSLIEFRKLYPDVTVELVITDKALDLMAGEADVAIRGAIGALPTSSLIARKINDDDFGLYCTRAYADQNGVPTLETLADHMLIGGDGELEGLPGLTFMFEHAGGAAPAFKSNTMTNLVASIRGGLGVGPLPSIIADGDPAMVRVYGPILEARGATWVVTRPDLRDAPRIRAFIDFLVPHTLGIRRAMAAGEGPFWKAQAEAASA